MNIDIHLSQTKPLRTLIRNATLILSMDPTMGTGELGLIEEAARRIKEALKIP